MKKYIIHWNAGFEDESKIVEVESIEKARKYAYDMWLEEAENNAEYDAEEYTKEAAEDLGLE